MWTSKVVKAWVLLFVLTSSSLAQEIQHPTVPPLASGHKFITEYAYYNKGSSAGRNFRDPQPDKKVSGSLTYCS